MRIVFLSAVYPPEREPAAVMAGQLVDRWIQDGYRVDVFCPFPNRPEGVVRQGWKRRVRQVDESEKLRVVRCWHWLVGRRRRIWDRLLENLTYGISASAQALIAGKPDVLVISTWPLFAVGVAILLARLWRVPAIYYVQDLYPEAAVEAGWLRRDHWITRILTRLDRSYCLSSSRVVLVSESMKELFTQGRHGLGGKVTVIRNWLDGDEIKPMRAGNVWRREHNIPPQFFLSTFAGSLSLLSGADVLVRAAEYLQDRQDIFLLCVGEGVLKQKMAAEAAWRGLTNIRFIPFQPRRSVSAMQSASDAMILTMRLGSGAASVPSKLITYLAAGRPVVCAAPPGSECYAIIRRSNAGINVPAGDARALADALLALAADRNAAERMGQRGRRYFEEHFTADRALREFQELLASVGQADSLPRVERARPYHDC
jgi:colanic acid biosynthesis glycosyl transferase WcaI